MKQLTRNGPCFADSFLNWRIYWLALAWLIEETVRYGILFWWVESCSHLQIMLVWSKVMKILSAKPILPCNMTGLLHSFCSAILIFMGNALVQGAAASGWHHFGAFQWQDHCAHQRESARLHFLLMLCVQPFRTEGFSVRASSKHGCPTDRAAFLRHIPDWRMMSAGSTRDQALYSARLALISAILYCIAAIAM